MIRPQWRSFFLTILASTWMFLTLGIISWWWIYSLKLVELAEQNPHVRRMFLWEGSFLLTTTILCGVLLIVLTYRDQVRHYKMKIFFSNFSHDIKTSISRIRLQSEILQEDHPPSEFPDIFKLLENISRLDLQLENSLYFANLNDNLIHNENLSLDHLLESIRSEWPEIQFIYQNIDFWGDRKAMLSILRNLVANAVLHGQATQIRFRKIELLPNEISNSPRGLSPRLLQIEMSADGLPFQGQLKELGRKPLARKIESHSGSNGLGLYLASELIKKMANGHLQFTLAEGGQLQVILTIPSHSISSEASQ